MLPDLEGLVAALDAAQVRCVVIGAVAVVAHGRIRATEDLDLVPDPDPENLDRLANALVTLDARLAADPDREFDPELRQALYREANLTLTTRLGDVDIVQRLPGVPSWNELDAHAERTRLGAAPLSVCSRSHLIAMKRARNSLQDQADVEILEGGSERA
jgi:hypothetical protein